MHACMCVPGSSCSADPPAFNRPPGGAQPRSVRRGRPRNPAWCAQMVEPQAAVDAFASAPTAASSASIGPRSEQHAHTAAPRSRRGGVPGAPPLPVPPTGASGTQAVAAADAAARAAAASAAGAAEPCPVRTPLLAITCTTNEPLPRLLQWIRYHQQLGFALFYFFIDDSEARPQAVHELRQLAGVKVLPRPLLLLLLPLNLLHTLLPLLLLSLASYSCCSSTTVPAATFMHTSAAAGASFEAAGGLHVSWRRGTGSSRSSDSATNVVLRHRRAARTCLCGLVRTDSQWRRPSRRRHRLNSCRAAPRGL